MANSVNGKYSVPMNFPELLKDFTREVLRERPLSVFEYGF